MRHYQPNTQYRGGSSKGRSLVGFAGVLIVVCSVATIWVGKLHYRNYWGGAIFAPFGIIIGLLAVTVAVRGLPLTRPDRRHRR